MKQARSETLQADRTPKKRASFACDAAFDVPRPLAVEKLRHRAVLHDADQRDRQTARQPKPKRKPKLNLTSVQAQRCTVLTAHLILSDGWPPKLNTRNSAPRRRQLDKMHAAFGKLALLRLTFPELDSLPLRSEELAALVRALVNVRVPALLLPDSSYTVDVQRGQDGSTHAHMVTPASALLPEHLAWVLAARHGPGGGCELDSLAHGVLMLDSPLDRLKVAQYVTRFPDGRADVFGTDTYLDAVEDELKRLQTAARRAPRLSWEVNLQRSL